MYQGIDYGEGTEQKGRVRGTGMGQMIAEQGQRTAIKMEQLRIE